MTENLPQLKDWRYEVDAEGIAWATFDRQNESMNVLGRRPTQELLQIVEMAEKSASLGDIIGLVFLSAKSNNFIAGADIREFEKMTTPEEARDFVLPAIELLNRVEKLRVPVVAAIHGYCLGGGLEFALACHYRIADREEGTRLGFPEVKLGIVPGLHGTLRSIHTAGPVGAMTTMLTARMLRSNVAKAIGLVDQLVATRHNLRWAARKAVLAKRKSKPLSFLKKLMLLKPARRFLANQMRKKTAVKIREDHYPAPFRLIDFFEKYGDDIERMRVEETNMFAPLMASQTSRNLRRVFKLSELLKAEAGDKSFKPMRVHVVGAGLMGGDIAAWCVFSGMEVSLQDLDAEQIEKARQRAKKLFRKRLKKKQAVDAAMARLIADRDGKHVPRADVIIEAIVEVLEVKQKVLAGLEKAKRKACVLATNTSSLKIEDIAQGLSDPSQLIGLHFFNPVAKMPLVEVIRGKDSDEAIIDKGASFVAKIRKSPLKVASAPGFLVNRVLAPYMMAAIARHQDGMPAEVLDQAALDFGMPMGPIELSDVVGLDIITNVGQILGISPPLGGDLDRLVKGKNLGKKTGRGFYKWSQGKPVKKDFDREAYDLDQLGRELLRTLVDECHKVVDEKVVANADLADAGVIFGTGFAPFRGGPLHYDQSLAEPENDKN
ncbi:MAG: 3-hydroxyacyl-CoA dehydrogenase NAD-binding domain-containing protein [Hyphomicrobiaceae bacterium]|nr:3-hydroxyacyl-CoA dehydrogenase NAD-binding domain-containing protein [Hyphomicrobiaceae bacterium]